MITVCRLTKIKHLDDCFSGEGGRATPARWTSGGRRVIYAADSPALAVLEILVHLDDSTILGSYRLRSAQLDRAIVEDVPEKTLPDKWKSHPPPVRLKTIGDRWLEEKRSVALRVPSAVAPGFNYLLNPDHPDFRRVTIRKGDESPLDARLQRLARRPA